MRCTTRFIAACWLLGASGAAADGVTRAAACASCHPSAAATLRGAMATRAGERAFARRAFGAAEGGRFFEQSCTGCHVSSCDDCHGASAHRPAGRPKDEACLRCHRGYFTGWEYAGRAPREDHPRYQRGPEANGERFLQMLPDVHHEKGLACADCHRVHARPGEPVAHAGAAVTTRGCRDCHPRVDAAVPEHAVRAHLERMECVACHAAWAPQEYGTFLVRGGTDEQREAFAALPSWGEWRKSAYLKRQDTPALGLNAAGRVAPIRPRFVLFATDPSRGWENRLLAAEWRAFTPHTVRRGAVTCGGCHDQPRRFLLEKDEDRVYLLDKDGLALRSFWSRAGQSVVNGAFLPEARHTQMNRKTTEYVRQHLRQWQNLLDRVDPPSRR